MARGPTAADSSTHRVGESCVLAEWWVMGSPGEFKQFLAFADQSLVLELLTELSQISRIFLLDIPSHCLFHEKILSSSLALTWPSMILPVARLRKHSLSSEISSAVRCMGTGHRKKMTISSTSTRTSTTDLPFGPVA